MQAETFKFINREALEQVLSCEFCGIFKNNFFQKDGGCINSNQTKASNQRAEVC